VFGARQWRALYLESPADAEDAVVGLLWRQALEGELDDIILLHDNVIRSAERRALDYCSRHVGCAGRLGAYLSPSCL
jgi:hypothetical protein